MKRAARIVGIVLAIGFVVLQFFRPQRDNPVSDPTIGLFSTAAIPPNVAGMVRNSCYDCHSNESRWPWYSNISPVSWLVANDVFRARRTLNFSEWGKYTSSKRSNKLERIQDMVTEGDMPLKNYLLIHRDAILTGADRKAISDWAEGEQKRIDAEAEGSDK